MPIDTSDDIFPSEIRDLRRYPLLYCELYKYVYGGVIKLELNMNYFIAFILEESQSQKYNEIPILSTEYKRLLSPLPQTSYKWANSSNLALSSPGVKEIYFLTFRIIVPSETLTSFT